MTLCCRGCMPVMFVAVQSNSEQRTHINLPPNLASTNVVVPTRSEDSVHIAGYVFRWFGQLRQSIDYRK